MSTIDSLLSLFNFIIVILGILVFGIASVFFINKYANNDESDTRILTKMLIYVVPVLIIFLIGNNYLQYNFNQKVTEELIIQLNKTPNKKIDGTEISLEANKFSAINFNDRFTSDSIYLKYLNNSYEIRLERSFEDSLKYWIYVEQYSNSSANEPIATYSLN